MRYAWILALAACAAPPPSFAPEDGPSSGPRMHLEADLSTAGQPRLLLIAEDLGPIFGLAAHVRSDDPNIAFGADGVAARIEAALQDARALAAAHDSDLALGGARASGDLDLGAHTVIAEIPIVVRAPVTMAHVTIEDAIVRRADSSYVATAAIGGTLSVSEVTP